MKINLLCVLVAGSVLMVACTGNYDIKSDGTLSEEALSVVRQRIQRGNDIVMAIEAYNNKHGQYPERLEQLVPDFLRVIPEPGLEEGDRYSYRKFPDDADKPYRYELWFFLPDTRPLLLALAGAGFSATYAEFNPAQLYEDTDVKTTHYVIDGWAIQTAYRSSHYKQQNERRYEGVGPS